MTFKDSGIEWLGEIPEHWEIKPLRAILNQRNEQNNDLKLQTILSLIKDIGVIPYEEKGNVGNKSKEDLQSYKIARINDLVLNKMNAVIGSLGVSAYNGLVSPIYLVFYIDNPKYLMSYYYYLFQIKSVQKFLKTFAYGIMEIRESIDYLDFKKMFLPTPIESFVDKKQRLIALLNEKKQALINECVTKGLSALCHCKALTRHSKDSPSCHSEALAEESTLLCHSEALAEESKNIESQDKESRCFAIAQHDRTEYKDSGIKHLGKIPSHWEIKKLKMLFSFGNGLNITKADFVSYGVPCVSYGEIHSKYSCRLDLSIHTLPFVSETYLADNPQSLLQKGDFVFADTSEDIEGSGNFTSIQSDMPIFAGYHTITLKPKTNRIHSPYFSFLFDSVFIRNQIRKEVCGVKVFSITKAILKEIQCIIPPIEEQKAIAEFLDSEISKIDSIIEKIKKQIELIKEYKNSLINQAVCGRIEKINLCL